jgi:hypothetical protein
MLLCLAASTLAGTYSVITLFPEDYSVRSGLTYNVKYIEKEPDGSMALVKEENTYYNARYPFGDPRNTNADSDTPVSSNIGFRSKIVRNPSDFLNPTIPSMQSYVSTNIVFIPYPEAKETIVYDKSDSSKYKSFAEKTTFDMYGNPKIVNSYGYTGNTKYADFSQNFGSYDVRNPIYYFNQAGATHSLNVYSQYTNMIATTSFAGESKPLDTKSIETTFLYQTDPIENYIPQPKKAHAFFGWTQLPSQTTVRDAFNRIISQTNVTYETNKSKYVSCNPYGHTDDWHCYGGRCVWQSPTKLMTFGGLGFGYDERTYDQSNIPYVQCWTTGLQPPQQALYCVATYNVLVGPNAISSNIYTQLDTCGNTVLVQATGHYLHPYTDNDPSRYGLENVSTLTKVVTSSFQYGQRVRPEAVTTVGPPDLTIKAEYFGDELTSKITNERGIATNYYYDALGRISKVVVTPDTTTSPTMQYEYGYDSTNSMLKIYEKVKISDSPLSYKQTYYFYDGMGRLTQVQTFDDNGTTITTDDRYIITGKEYDVMGRPSKEYRPTRIKLADFTYGFGTYEPDAYTSTTYLEHTYDSLGRETSLRDTADNTVTAKSYSLDTVYGQDITTTTDAANNVRTYYADSRGNLVSVGLPTP